MKSRNRITIEQSQRLSLTMGLATSIRILRADAAGLSRYLEEQAAENPQLVLKRQVTGEWLPRWADAFARHPGGMDLPEPEAAGPSLIAHVSDAMAAMNLSPPEARIAEALAEALEPTGWLGRPLAAIARQVGVPEAEAKALLRKVQDRIEPAGLFAQSLVDCLRLQAEDAGQLDAAMAGVLMRLDLVASGDIARIARELAVEEGEVRQKIAQLRQYDPKPGSHYVACAAPVREPDLIAEKGSSGWEISLNRSALPTLSLAEVKGKGRAEARALIRMVEGRNATLLTVGREILMRQAMALEQGVGALVPMTMAEVAEALNLHKSTISRVVAGTSVDTPKGTWWLRALFSKSLTADGAPAAALRERLSRLIAAEEQKSPLSDEALAEALSATGSPIARRTVAKYRGILGLPPAHRRRKAR
jgi:RNA polymerase sigma-54 factor